VSTYELDDDLVRKLVGSSYAPDKMDAATALADVLKEQLPIPVPGKVGAAVRTEMDVRGPRVFIRWATDNHTHSPWIEAGNHEQPYRTDEIGRITEVLSLGVEL
jgi:hypothetical protein